ncbi:MAG: Rieske 2Fe-2S domain-containing protein [Chloroflexi bacterium]|nr:Rieske 2Fe-2S domain-containing protein [Chloroflexota bacterium]
MGAVEVFVITHEENERLTRVGPGTPMGALLRRYWQPVCAAAELTAERPKQRIRILGEDLVVFRQPDGSYGLVAERCSHRGASLYYGFLEDGGIRCPYHGWLYDAGGACLEQPFEPAQSMMKHTLRHPAYPVQKLAGIVFAYMGPPDRQPILPRWDILLWESGTRTIEIRPVLNCSWLQAEENTADVTHTYFLHAYTFAKRGRPQMGGGFGRPFAQYGFQPFPWGLLKSWIYEGPRGGAGWGNLLVFPNMLRLEGAMHWRVPIDDTHTRIVRMEFRPSPDGSPAEQPGEPPVTYEPSWLNEEGEYHMDTFSSHDGMAWETQGPIFDRTAEHLGASDFGIVLLRRMLFDAMAAVHRGEDPQGIVRDPEQAACIDLESWLAERDYSAGTMEHAMQVRRRAREEVFDESHRVVDIPSTSTARQGTS